MNAAVKLGAFAAAVAMSFGGAAALGAVVGPIDIGDGDSAHSTMSDTAEVSAAASLRGLAVGAAGHRLVLDATSLPADKPSTFGFAIVDDAGVAVTGFDLLHERRLHLIVLSRDLVEYHHLHPIMDDAGHWTVELPALPAGSYRVFADFQPIGGENLTLGSDVSVVGAVETLTLPDPASTYSADGYTVTLSGRPNVGEVELAFSVTRSAQVVETEPYLGAAGHLVAIRSADLAYLHVHPHDSADDSAAIVFTADFPTAGRYRLFLDYSHDGTVRTASFTIDVPETSAANDDDGDTHAHDEAGH